jgi:peptidoglycan/xylan/chitin deacetylase (PgdA/CDA1 family)
VSAVVPVFVGAPPDFFAKASWVLATLCAASGATVLTVREPDRAASCALAYAPLPLPGVPTVPQSADAVAVIRGERPLERGAFAPYTAAGRHLVGAFPWTAVTEADAAGFVAPFDLVASAFVLLAAWDEHTSTVRDRYGRLPYSESLFARNLALDLVRPAVDEYARLVRDVLAARLAALGLPPLPDVGVGEGDGETGKARFAVALTHDVDNVRRWTGRGLMGTVRRAVAATRTGDRATARWEAGALARALAHDLPRGRDPYWTFPDLLASEDAEDVDSTFFLIASHNARLDGVQPRVYQKRLPTLTALLTAHGREVGLHGNDRDRVEGAGLRADRDLLRKFAGRPVAGVRFHYLRCLYHETLPLLDAEGFVYDTSLAFAEREGYRCGFSHPFHPFDLRRDRPLDLVELPLAVMDSTLQEPHYRGLRADAARGAALAALAPLARSGGAAAVLWHQNRFDPHVGRGYDAVYWDLVRWVRREGGLATSAAEAVATWRRRVGEAPT